jgi:hypothetical protein
VSLFDRIADRIHARHDEAARAQGLTVTRLPGGRRQISHPALPALLEQRRRHALLTGSPDVLQALAMDPGTAAVLARTQAQLDREDAALGLAAHPRGLDGQVRTWQRAAESWAA